MRLYVLFGQRKERFPGEYKPEALAVMDEWGQSDNPEYLELKETEARDSGEFESVAVVAMEVDGAAVEGRLRPAKPVLQAQIFG